MTEDFETFYSALSVRSQAAITYSGCRSIDDVRKFMADRRQAMSMGNFGKKSYTEVAKALAEIPLPKPMINDLLDKLEEANRIFGAGGGNADVELCRKQVDDEIKRKDEAIAYFQSLSKTYANEFNRLHAEIDELKGLLEE